MSNNMNKETFRIRIKSKEEINKTLDKNGELGMCAFIGEMFDFCGEEFEAKRGDEDYFAMIPDGYGFHPDWYDVIGSDNVPSEQTHTSMKSIEDLVFNRLDDIRDELADMTEYRKKLLAERKELNNVKKAL